MESEFLAFKNLRFNLISFQSAQIAGIDRLSRELEENERKQNVD